MSRIFNSESVNSDTITVGAQALVVSDTGPVGIGTDQPVYKLDVRSSGATTLRVSRIGSVGDAPSIVLEEGNSTLGSGSQTSISTKNGDLIFSSNSLERLFIDNNGSIGINDSSPVTVVGYGRALNISDNNGGTLILKDSNTTTNYKIKWFSSVDGVLIYGRSNDDGSSPVTQLTIDHTGNLSLKVGGSYMRLAYDSSDSYSSTLGWNWINLGNNGANDIIAGKTASGGFLRFYVNNTTDVTASNTSNGTLALTINSTNLDVNTSHSLSFGSATRQMINLWSTSYGIGVQSGTTYFRSGQRFSWFVGGVHSVTENDAGTGGTSVMTLTSTGLGLGSSPSYKLHVVGDSYVNGAYRGVIQRGSYGSISIRGVTNTYAGIDFTDSAATFMVRTDGLNGVYQNDSYWNWYWSPGNPGTLTVGNVPWARLTDVPSNSLGNRTISSSTPAGGSNGDIWYQV